MTWSGYLTFDGTEIANAARFETYVGPRGWFRAIHGADDLPALLEETYTDPITDEAPWYDPDVAASGRFWGVYPMDLIGFDSSARESEVVESSGQGATPGRLRHGSKAVVCSVILAGEDTEACDYGMMWLRRALIGAKDSDSLTTDQALGVTVGYLAAEPKTDPSGVEGPAAILARLKRYAHHAVVNNGPSPLSKHILDCGAAVITATFTIVAGSPFEFGEERAILQDWLDAVDPWVPGVPNGVIDGPTTYVDIECGTNLWAPIFDPECPALIVPPPPAAIPLGCYTPPVDWQRYTVTIPEEVVPDWGQVVPKMTVYAPTEELRNIRFRFYEDPDGDADPDDDPCGFVGDFVVSYVPAGGALVLDSGLEEIYVITDQGFQRRADSLVFRTDGTPFDWPSLSNGYGYIMVLDVGDTGPLPIVDLSLTSRVV